VGTTLHDEQGDLMRKPAIMYTKSGLAEYNAQLHALEKSVDYFINQEDDLHLDERFMERLYEMREYLFNNRTVLEEGDGEDEDSEPYEEVPAILI